MSDPNSEWIMKALDAILHKVGKVDVLIETQQKQERLLEKLAEAVNKLAVIEANQAHDRQALERAFNALADAEKRIEAERGERNANIEKVVNRLEQVMQKLHTRIDEVESRTDELEKSAPTNALASNWVLEGAKALAVVAIVFALTKAGLIQ